MSDVFKKALDIATKAHKGQVDKAGAPYILHPLRVAWRCNTEDEMIVALLHDTIEDTEVTAQTLYNCGFPKRIVEAVLSVTRQKGEIYQAFIERCNKNGIGRNVKLHDLEDNLDVTRLGILHENDMRRLNKYLLAYKYLKNH